MSEWIKKLAEGYKTVNENQKAALQKKLAKASASSEKGKKAVTLPKAPFDVPDEDKTKNEGVQFHIPEDVPVDERDMFMAKAAAAHKAGQSHFTMNGKKHPVTMKKDTAKAVNSSTNEEKEEKKEDHMRGSMMRDRLKKKMAKNEDEEIVMNPKKEKKEKGATSDEAGMAAESVTPRVYSRIIEARGTADKDGKHYKKASDSEEMDSKDSPGGKQMRKDMEGPKMDDPEQSDQMTKAANAAPNPQMRKGDNKAGDKKIIPSATPTKGM